MIDPILAAVDLEDESQRSLMHAQRLICGWGADDMPVWRDCIRTGDRAMFWICLRADSTEALSSAPSPALGYISVPADNGDTLPLRCLAVGQLALDRKDLPLAGVLHREQSLTAVDGSRMTVASLMVLPQFQSMGLGSWAMLEIEQFARSEPHGSSTCDTLTVNTLSRRHCKGGLEGIEGMGMWDAIGLQMPERSNVAWFEALGYSTYKEYFRFCIKARDGSDVKVWVECLEKHLGAADKL